MTFKIYHFQFFILVYDAKKQLEHMQNKWQWQWILLPNDLNLIPRLRCKNGGEDLLVWDETILQCFFLNLNGGTKNNWPINISGTKLNFKTAKRKIFFTHWMHYQIATFVMRIKFLSHFIFSIVQFEKLNSPSHFLWRRTREFRALKTMIGPPKKKRKKTEITMTKKVTQTANQYSKTFPKTKWFGS